MARLSTASPGGVVLDPGVGLLDSGSVLFADANGRISEDNANFFWDDAANTLKVPKIINGTRTVSFSSASAGVLIDDTATGNVKLIVRGAAGQTVDYFRVQDSGNIIKFWVTSDAVSETHVNGILKTNNNFFPGDTTGSEQSVCGLRAGVGAPVGGGDGDIYFRSDGASLTTIYQKRLGIWVGIV